MCLSCNVIHSPSYITIALLNVRSLIAKLADIKIVTQNMLPYCFCETWLTQLQTDNQIALRCDRASGVNKGGIMISEHNTCSLLHTITSNDIEQLLAFCYCLMLATSKLWSQPQEKLSPRTIKTPKQRATVNAMVVSISPTKSGAR